MADPPAHPDARGFTLIEMLVVLVIVAIVGGIVLTHGPTRSAALEARAAAAQVAGALRQGRARAIALNRPVSVVFDRQRETWRIGGDPPHPLPRGIDCTVTPATNQDAAIGFLPDGSSTGGQVVLAGRGRAIRVGVDWLTGRVSTADAT